MLVYKTNMTTPLIQYNQLAADAEGVWHQATDSRCHYSDGAETEAYLGKVLSQARDLSSSSAELEARIIDWPSEYHLSSARANLLRFLDLSSTGNVLELGCGCGALTRYLAEQGLTVDAIEGAAPRAALAKLRCRDLSNASIVCSNFNQLTLPPATYALTMLVGVVEYAGRFMEPQLADRQAARALLERAAASLAPDGVLLVAIENRLGLKYWLGASEDHHGRPLVGLYGYPRQSGMRTYDRNEWARLLTGLGLGHVRWAFPFPDYKLPQVVLAEKYIARCPYAHQLLYRVGSRDYGRPWRLQADEFLLWDALHQSGYLPDFSNSFLIIASRSRARVDALLPYDFAHFSEPRRRPGFRNMTCLPAGTSTVCKRRLIPTVDDAAEEQAGVPHHVRAERAAFLDGSLLATHWLRALLDGGDHHQLRQLLQDYIEFLRRQAADNPPPNWLIDCLPFNIITDDAGAYHPIDTEWHLVEPVMPEYVLFRALLWFGFSHPTAIQPLCEQHELHTLKDFVLHLLGWLGIDLTLQLEECTAREERLQSSINFQAEPDPVRRLLLQPLPHRIGQWTPRSFRATLYWITAERDLNPDAAFNVEACLGQSNQHLFFSLPALSAPLLRLRFDPAEREGFFHMRRMALHWRHSAEQPAQTIWSLEGAEAIAEAGVLVGVHFCPGAFGSVFLSTGPDPQMIFEMPEDVKARGAEGRFVCEVEMDWPWGADYQLVFSSYREKVQAHALLETTSQARIRELQAEIKAKDAVIAQRDALIAHWEYKLGLLRNTHLYRFFEKLKRLIYSTARRP